MGIGNNNNKAMSARVKGRKAMGGIDNDKKNHSLTDTTNLWLKQTEMKVHT